MYATDTDRAALAGIGARLREARDRRGLTNRQLAQAIGCEQVTIYRYLNGQRALPVTAVADLAKLTGTTVEWLLTGEGPQTPEVPHQPDDPVVQHELVPCRAGHSEHQDVLIVRASGRAELICPATGRHDV